MEGEGGGEVCLEIEVERLWRSGVPPDEIAGKTGLSPAWVEEVISAARDGEEPGDRRG